MECSTTKHTTGFEAMRAYACCRRAEGALGSVRRPDMRCRSTRMPSAWPRRSGVSRKKGSKASLGHDFRSALPELSVFELWEQDLRMEVATAMNLVTSLAVTQSNPRSRLKAQAKVLSVSLCTLTPLWTRRTASKASAVEQVWMVRGIVRQSMGNSNSSITTK